MEAVLRYRGREVTQSDVVFLRQLIKANPDKSRRALSKLVCEAWDWRQPNGMLRDMVCRSLMLELHRADHIELPPVRFRPHNNAVRRRRQQAALVDSTALRVRLSELSPLIFDEVRRSAQERLFDSLIETYHYLGYTRPVGEHLKFLVTTEGRLIACFAWSSAPRHLGPRDRFIGWSPPARRANIRFLAYNTRFLILPWVQVPHLASYLLGRMARMLSAQWERAYAHPIYYLESFVDPQRYRGICYRAANWHFLGLTRGLGKDSTTMKPDRSFKEVLGYPLTKCFRELLATVR